MTDIPHPESPANSLNRANLIG